MRKLLTPQVRTFIYGATAALLSVATVQGWITQDLSKAIETSLPTIIGAIATIIAAANVKAPQVEAPAVPVKVADVPVTHVAQAAAVELPVA
jgi:hypothetical protein